MVYAIAACPPRNTCPGKLLSGVQTLNQKSKLVLSNVEGIENDPVILPVPHKICPECNRRIANLHYLMREARPKADSKDLYNYTVQIIINPENRFAGE